MKRLDELRIRAVAVAGSGSLVVIAFIVAVKTYTAPSLAQDAVVSVLVAVLSILVTSVIWDVAMRKSFANELMDLVRLEKGLRAAGIKDILQEPDINWRQFMTGMSEFHFVVRDVKYWRESRLAQLLDETHGSQIRVHLYVPDPSEVKAGQYLGLDEVRYEQDRQELQRAWDQARTARRVHAQSTLEQWALPGPPQFMAACARKAGTVRYLLVLWPRVPGGGEPAVAFRFEAGPSSPAEVGAWIDQQLSPLRVETNKVLL